MTLRPNTRRVTKEQENLQKYKYTARCVEHVEKDETSREIRCQYSLLWETRSTSLPVFSCHTNVIVKGTRVFLGNCSLFHWIQWNSLSSLRCSLFLFRFCPLRGHYLVNLSLRFSISIRVSRRLCVNTTGSSLPSYRLYTSLSTLVVTSRVVVLIETGSHYVGNVCKQVNQNTLR